MIQLLLLHAHYHVDHLMFDVDPETVKTGVESEVMQYMRAWKLIYIYVSFLHYICVIWANDCTRKNLFHCLRIGAYMFQDI
jgi:hypothetical protein